jgi:CDP-glycerol glycerophosphotransferase
MGVGDVSKDPTASLHAQKGSEAAVSEKARDGRPDVPAISIVLCSHNAEQFLRTCLDSLVDQMSKDIEIIAVDDASSDDSLGILDEYAQRDERIRVVRLSENGGVGPARNAGLERALGDYVWFVDADDWIAPNTLALISEKLKSRPDVLLFGWSRVYPDGEIVPCPAEHLLAGAPAEFSLQEWPDAIKILHTPWNKIVRRDLLTRTGYRFSPGWYQDLSFTYGVLSAATRITTMPLMVVNYRQHEAGAMRTRSEGHLVVLKQWERVFQLVNKDHPRSGPVQNQLFVRMVWHLLSVLKHPDRLPKNSLGDFAAGAARLWRAHVPPEYRVPNGITGVEHRLLRHGLVGVRLIRVIAAVNQKLRHLLGMPQTRLLLSPKPERTVAQRTAGKI